MICAHTYFHGHLDTSIGQYAKLYGLEKIFYALKYLRAIFQEIKRQPPNSLRRIVANHNVA